MKAELDRLREEWIRNTLASPAVSLEASLRKTWDLAASACIHLLSERLKRQTAELIRRQAH